MVKTYRIKHTPKHSRMAILTNHPAYLECSDGTIYTFRGGYGATLRTPTQEGCAVLAAWMNQQKLLTTERSLTEMFDIALAHYNADA